MKKHDFNQSTEHAQNSLAVPPISRRGFNSTVAAIAGSTLVSGCGEGQINTNTVKKPSIDSTKQLVSLYVPMRDGVKIAVDVWMPLGNKGKDLPTLISATRYGRSFQTPGKNIQDNTSYERAIPLNSKGYVFVAIDARGSGASFGTRTTELSREEILDYNEIIDWLATQSWSNGRVGSYGYSYEADTAELMASLGNKYLTAVASLSGDFDVYRDLVYPGGVQFEAFTIWVSLTQYLDGVIAPPPGSSIPTVSPVDGPDGLQLLAQAQKEHNSNARLSETFAKNQYRDDVFYKDFLMSYFQSQIQTSKVAFYVQVGWVDAGTAAGALERFSLFTNSQEVWIAPWNHGGEVVDPLSSVAPSDTTAIEPAAQIANMLAFFDRHVKNIQTPTSAKTLNISSYGKNQWVQLPSWPPAGVQSKKLQITGAGLIESNSNVNERLVIPAKAHTSGTGSRWRGNVSDTLDYSAWNDSASSRRSLRLAPLQKELKIMGFPIVSVFVDSSEPDGVLFAYLEAVLPDNSVVYLTEGVIRLGLRGSKQPALRTDQRLERTLAAKDLAPMKPGTPELIVFEMYPLAAALPAGASLQLSFASSDTDNFKRYATDQAVLQIVLSSSQRSELIMPVVQ
jgi:uncharacterized protein